MKPCAQFTTYFYYSYTCAQPTTYFYSYACAQFTTYFYSYVQRFHAHRHECMHGCSKETS